MELINEDLNSIKKILNNSVKNIVDEDVIKNFVSHSGKMVRSSLALLYYKALGYSVDENVLKVLTAGELIHNASLLHDDVIDNAEERRGNKTIAKTITPKFSILAGDYLIVVAMELLLTIKNDKVVSIFNNTAKKMTEGEIKQFFLRNQVPTKDDYIEICKNKTSALFSSILKSVAILLNADEDKASNLGELFGLIFQINNDMDYKSAKEDVKNGVATALSVLGIENTKILLDNLKQEISELTEQIPNNSYKKGLEDLVSRYVR